jgi:hypothetical protein
MLTSLDRPLSNEPSEQHPEGGWAALKALIAALVRRGIITDDDLQKVLAHALRDLDAQAGDTPDPKALAAAKELISAFRHQ